MAAIAAIIAMNAERDMQRIARLLVVVVVIATLGIVPVRAQESPMVTIDLFLSGDDLVVRDDFGCAPVDGVGASTISLGDVSRSLGRGTFQELGESPMARAGCRFSLGLAVTGSDPYAVMLGDVEIGYVTAAELDRLDNRLQIAIWSSEFVVESVDWRFPSRNAESARTTPIATSPATETTPTRTSSRHAPPYVQRTPDSTATAPIRATATTASRSRDADRWGCADLQAYQDEMFSLLRSVEEFDAVEAFFEADDFTMLRPSVLRGASAGFDEWAGLLEEMDDVPLAAQEYHQNMIDYASLISIVLISYANGGVFAVTPYTDAMDTITSERDAASRLGERRCGDAWTDVFGS